MGERSSYEPGTFCWVDLETPDEAGAREFYGALFGWTLEGATGEGGSAYARARLRGADVAGIKGGEAPRWTSWVAVEDADADASRAGELGGSVVAGPADVVGGRRAEVADPAGAVVGIWQPGELVGAGLVNEPGVLCWNELALPEPAAVERFYAELLGWRLERVPTPGGAPEIVAVANRAGGRNGNLRAADQPAAWTPYFGAESCPETAGRAAELGGRILFGPIELPSGRMAVIADPQGAVFGLVDGRMDP